MKTCRVCDKPVGRAFGSPGSNSLPSQTVSLGYWTFLPCEITRTSWGQGYVASHLRTYQKGEIHTHSSTYRKKECINNPVCVRLWQCTVLQEENSHFAQKSKLSSAKASLPVVAWKLGGRYGHSEEVKMTSGRLPLVKHTRNFPGDWAWIAFVSLSLCCPQKVEVSHSVLKTLPPWCPLTENTLSATHTRSSLRAFSLPPVRPQPFYPSGPQIWACTGITWRACEDRWRGSTSRAPDSGSLGGARELACPTSVLAMLNLPATDHAWR